MRRFVLGVLVFIPLFGAETTVVRCGKLLDVVSGELRSNVDVTVEGNAITRVGPAGAGAPTVDLSRGYCLPGLIDVHDHITSDPQHSGYAALGISIPRETVIGVKNARNTLQAGFTTIRN
ncbi:MAG: amidohydrolase family protein, partial [Bryobacteraceae bacterium]